MNKRSAALLHGWRSGFEEAFAADLDALGATYAYEEETLEFEEPAKQRKYTPDFTVRTRSGNKIYIETKGRWVTADRLKMALVLQQHRDKDIRIVFQRPTTRISKTSKTTYAQYAERIGLRWSSRRAWQAWLNE